MRILSLVLLALMPVLGWSQELKIDTKSASVSFNYVHEKTKGTLSNVNATIALNPTDLASSTIKGSVDVTTISTGVKMRDKHLKSKSYFDAEKYPKMKFTSSSIEATENGFKAKGTLTIKDIQKPVSFDIKEKGDALVFSTEIYAADYGVAIKKDRAKSKVLVSVTIKTN